MANKKTILMSLGGLSLLAIFYFAYEHIMYVSTDNAQVEAHTVMLAPKVSGYVQKVFIVEGQRVKAGEVLVEIDPQEYENSLVQKKGEMASLEARRKEAQQNFTRLKNLLSSGAVSQQQFDTAFSNYSSSMAQYDAVAAQVSQAELNVKNTKIVAPSDGFIAKKSVEVGQFFSPGVPLIGFVDAGERWVVANFKETQIADVKVGALVDVDVDAVTSKSFEGKVESLSSATGATFTLLPPDNATGNFTKVVQRIPVKIKMINLKEGDVELLRAGLSADIKVHKR
jgi:membrane fusion protein (multidrug efflux system)